MAITWNGSSLGTTATVNFNNTNMCGIVSCTNGCPFVARARETICGYSNNYAGLEYRIWVDNLNTGQICYCWRTCSQDADSYVCNLNINYTGTVSCINMGFKLVGRNSQSNARISFCGNGECSSNVYLITIPQCVMFDYWNWTVLGAPGRINIYPNACSAWQYGSLTIPTYLAHCFYYHGMCCQIDIYPRWVPHYTRVRIHCENTANGYYTACLINSSNATGITCCYQFG